MFDRLDEKSHSWPFVAPQATPRNSQAASISRMDIGNTIFTEESILTIPTKLNTRPHSSEDVNGNIDDLGPVKPLGTASCSRSSVFLLFSRDYHSGLLSVTSVCVSLPVPITYLMFSRFKVALPETQVFAASLWVCRGAGELWTRVRRGGFSVH